MAMNFWLARQQAKRNTMILVIAFIILTFGVGFLAEAAVETFSPEYTEGKEIPFVGLFFVGGTFLIALFNYVMYKSQGGAYVAEAVGGVPLPKDAADPRFLQLRNIIEEISVAAALPKPAVYILQNDQINAFAAGTTPENACICVTTGALRLLNRDELQGVVAHEFGHIKNYDVKLGTRLAAMLMGFYFVFYIALRTLQFSPRRNGGDRGGQGVILIALALVAAGAISWVAGKILSSMVSRQREYLADASSVQFTRNPDGLISALKKLMKVQTPEPMPKSGMAFTHLYFNHPSFTSLFDTHPPLEKRIEALQGGVYKFEDK